MIRLALVAATALVFAAPTPASAARGRARAGGSSADMLSVWLALDPGPIDGVGIGGRYMFPLVPEGVLNHPRVKDEFTLELGVDFIHYEDRVGDLGFYTDYSWNGLLPVVGATWNFWFTPQFAVYPKLDLGWFMGWYDGPDPYAGYNRYDFDGLFLQGAVGVIYRLERVALRAEAGSGLLRLGVGFAY